MTQHLTEKDVRGIATYARIGLTDEEVTAMTEDLNNIIESLPFTLSEACQTLCAKMLKEQASRKKRLFPMLPSSKMAAS